MNILNVLNHSRRKIDLQYTSFIYLVEGTQFVLYLFDILKMVDNEKDKKKQNILTDICDRRS